jgi:methyltransferase-like protein/SAM-dependent methyltransferase
MMTKTADMKSSYDEIPYESHAFAQSHPDRLATLGLLFGMSPVPVERCRVLELGCASGGNLIPMAFQLPGGEFVGVDYSVRQVEMGRLILDDLDMKNIRIEQGSILDINRSWGNFDYILCHGVYSWVPDTVQDKILAVCSANLAPQGVAYVSYNTYPGWHMREMIRHMMIYHTKQFNDTGQRIQQARALIDFLARSVPTKDNHYGLLLKSELELIKRSKDYYLFHEHLEDENAPIYFYQFAERADRHGLQYLAEAEFDTMLASGFPKEVADTLKRISPQIVQTEQYMDFLRNRLFRQTLLCHKDVVLKRNIGPTDLDALLVASSAAPMKGPINLTSTANETFKTPRGATLQTNRVLTKAAFVVLREQWPRAMDMDSLLGEVGKRLDIGGSQTEQGRQQNRRILQADLLQCYSANVVEFHTWQAPFVSRVNDSPQISPLAAYQVAKGLPVVNQRHESVSLDAVTQQIAPFLDGTKDHKTLHRCMKNLVEKGLITIRQDNKPVSDAALIEQYLEKALMQTLSNLAAQALLI